MYQRIIKPVLFSLTIERAHRAVLLTSVNVPRYDKGAARGAPSPRLRNKSFVFLKAPPGKELCPSLCLLVASALAFFSSI